MRRCEIGRPWFTLIAMLGMAAPFSRSLYGEDEKTPPRPNHADSIVIEKAVGALEVELGRARARLDDDDYFRQFPTSLERAWERERLFRQLVHGSSSLRSPQEIPSLIKLIGVNHASRDATRLNYTYGSKMSGAPAWHALREIGIPAVPALLDLLKEDPKAETEHNISNTERQDIALRILSDIYEIGGHGEELLELRLKLEIESATGVAKERLENALERLKRLDYDAAQERKERLEFLEWRRQRITPPKSQDDSPNGSQPEFKEAQAPPCTKTLPTEERAD